MKKIISYILYLVIAILFISSQDLIQTEGPNGETPVNYRAIGFGNSDKQEIANKNLKAAILMHTTSDFTEAVISGAEDRFKLLEVDVVFISSANFDPGKQKEDIKKAIELEVDIIITLIIDPDSGGEALKEAVDRGIKVALLSNLPMDFVHSRDYSSIVTDDLFSMGKSLAEMMGDELEGRGDIVYFYHDANYYVTNQRDQAFEFSITRLYPDINILKRVGISNPSEAKGLMDEILTNNPGIEAVYAPWATIAEGVVESLKDNEKEDIKVFTMDLGRDVSLNMAMDGAVSGIVADLPYTIGYTLASVASLSAIDRVTPPFITVPAIKVTKKNLEQMWERAYRTEAPEEVQEALK